MTPEEVRKLIDYNSTKKIHKELLSVYEQKSKTLKNIWNFFKKSRTESVPLSKESAYLGLLFLDTIPKYRDQNHKSTWYYNSKVWKESKRFTAFQKLYDIDNLWEGEHYQLLIFLFGKELAPYIKKAWQQLPYAIYQTTHYRRSFRRPHDKVTHQVRQINFIINLINSETTHPFSIKEAISYANRIVNYDGEIPLVWAAAIDDGNEDILQHIIEILTGEAEVGTVSRPIIKTLLLCNSPQAWKQVGDLLLAAQRQEGLRQTILECIDETSEGALQYMIDLVLDHNLIRFSSVVRALDVWAGFGWNAEKQSTVKRFMELAQKYYSAPDLIKTAIDDKDNAEVYMSLWGLGAHDVDKCLPYLKSLYEKGSIEKKTLVLYFVFQTNIKEWCKTFGYLAIAEESYQLIYWALKLLQNAYGLKNDEVLFERLLQLYNDFDKKEIVFSGKVFSWLTFTFKKATIGRLIVNMIKDEEDPRFEKILPLFKEMDVSNREEITRKILAQFTYYRNEKTENIPNTKQRDFAFFILKDRSSFLRSTAMKTLKNAELSLEEIQFFEGLLTRKSAAFRLYVLELIQKKSVKEIFTSAERLIRSGNLEQRLAGLDLLNFLFSSSEHEAQVKELASAYSQRKKIGRKERILLDNLLKEKVVEFNEENGYGLYDTENIISASTPQAPTTGDFVERQKVKYPFGLSMPVEKIAVELETLKSIFLENKDYEYEIEYWNGTRRKVLLANTFSQVKKDNKDFTPRQHFENFPLFEKWENWYKESKLTPFDLFLISFSNNTNQYDENVEICFPKTYKNIKNAIIEIDIPKVKKNEYAYNSPIKKILQILNDLYPYQEKTAYLLAATQSVFSKIHPSELGEKRVAKKRWGTNWETVFDLPQLVKYFSAIHRTYKEENFTNFWELAQFVYQNTIFQNYKAKVPSIRNYAIAYQYELCNKDELMKRIMTIDGIRILTQKPAKGRNYLETKKLLTDFSFLIPFIEKAKERILEVELRRGDSSTCVTLFAQSIGVVYGVDYLIQILNGLGKDTLNRGYIYAYGNKEYSKKEVLSTLLKRCFPKPEETQADFNKAIKAAKFTEKRLVELGLYAQQWLKFINEYLGWEGMESAAWWLHAHTNSYHNAETETEIARFSNIDMKKFKDGAVDYEWFHNAYKALGKKRWKTLYDAAKYISDGAGHNRAKLYADVMTGATKIREVTKRIKDKRNKDYVRVFGLVPLSKKTPDKDVLSRYNFLLNFKKESRKFGVQRQASEQLATQVAIENLARTASYPDPIRLTWAMETEEAKAIMENAKTLNFDNVTISLQVDKLGKSSIICKREDKLLKNIPAKLRKEKPVLALKDFHKRLKEQYRRSRKSLEDAMVRGDIFQAKEIQTLSTHPVIAPMLSSLVLVSEDGIGFYQAGKLVSMDGKKQKLGANIRIAHCTDFYREKNWAGLQKYCFDEKIVQPFKQVFRELYVPTPDELQEKTISRRYAGHQIQPKKTVALLKTRGWTVSYEEGLQKVYHDKGMIAKIYALADWFSPADVESPTLETVEFLDRKTYKKIPFATMNPLIFSEVMRDVDLVVSVAHVGGVDPEASHSTVEMRAAIIRETSRLFKLKNVTIKGHHALIKGHHATYSVHLGSAVTHLMPGKYLSILPVHSQHRGRLFLPFVDEDPKSAEVMSKILLLAKDAEIKDPTILSQIGV